ncbi:hypothetical protein Taro_013041, partial [Colocasia esculenta]|nr:hypothetical protein [Colocasia esculenta]
IRFLSSVFANLDYPKKIQKRFGHRPRHPNRFPSADSSSPTRGRTCGPHHLGFCQPSIAPSSAASPSSATAFASHNCVGPADLRQLQRRILGDRKRFSLGGNGRGRASLACRLQLVVFQDQEISIVLHPPHLIIRDWMKLVMDHMNACNMEESGPASGAIFQVVGEPAVCINGVPEVSQVLNSSILPRTTNHAEPCDDPCLGEWLEGREVRKLFGNKYYSGKVVKFDPEMKWYRVVYEDGDFEDLEWHELEEVLVPLDISVSLRTLIQQVYEYRNFVASLEGNTTKSGKELMVNVTSINNMPMQF